MHLQHKTFLRWYLHILFYEHERSINIHSTENHTLQLRGGIQNLSPDPELNFIYGFFLFKPDYFH